MDGQHCERGGHLAAFLTALSFLTVLPVRRVEPLDLARSAPWFPIVGLVVSVPPLLADPLAVAAGWSPLVRATLTLALIVFLTGMLHLDGLMDTADGLASGHSGEAMLAVMRDGRVGAAGALAGCFFVVFAVSLLAEIDCPGWRNLAVVQALVAGRLAIVLGAVSVRTGALPTGLARALLERVTVRGAAGAMAAAGTALAPFVLLASRGAGASVTAAVARCLAGLVLGPALGLGLGHRVSRRLGGLSGDVLGAVGTLTELVVLAVYAAG